MSVTAVADRGIRIADALSPAEYLRIAREIRSGPQNGLRPVKVAFLSSFTFQFIEPVLVVEAARQGLRAATYIGGFGQFEQEVLGGAGLRAFDPDVLVIAMRPEDVDPDAIARYHATGGRRFAELAAGMTRRVEDLIAGFRGWSRAPVAVANYATPARLPFGICDANLDGSLTYALAAANDALRRSVAGCPGTVVWDYAGLVHATGTESWTDPRLWSMARVPVAPRHQPALARHLVRTLLAARREPAKCLVLDLDNTLWGGVIGDDGMTGIHLGDDFPGSVYKSFQRSALSLMDRGVLLAVCSKNDPDIVDRVLREHPEMLIRPEHISASRVGWGPKSHGLREIAAELGIGSDALVLFDDNPVEREEVRANAPEVGVVEVPADPLRYDEALWGCGFFDQLALSDEDLRRTAMYREEKERRVFASGFQSVDQFLASLEMVAEVGEADTPTLARVAQLINKTNQFNLTARRRTLAELEALSRNPRHHIVWVRIRDRFGDQGIIAVAILRVDDDAAVIDSLLMSCRMMNRRVEEALMAELAARAHAAQRSRLIGEYITTPRNSAVADLYARLGFEAVAASGDGIATFELDLARQDLPWPEVLDRTAPA